MSTGRSDNAIAAFYRRPAARRQGDGDHRTRQNHRFLRSLRKRAERLGYRLVDAATGELLEAPVS
jgi:hypothetical protein